jgi:hypothetical protein
MGFDSMQPFHDLRREVDPTVVEFNNSKGMIVFLVVRHFKRKTHIFKKFTRPSSEQWECSEVTHHPPVQADPGRGTIRLR